VAGDLGGDRGGVMDAPAGGELPKVGDQVLFIGFGGQQVGTVERIGPKNVTLWYVSGSEAKHARKYHQEPHRMRRSYPRAAFHKMGGAWWASEVPSA
jgi:hypothetical protein